LLASILTSLWLLLRLLDPDSLQQFFVIYGLIFILNRFRSCFSIRIVFEAEGGAAHSERTPMFFRSDFWFGFASWLIICLASLVVFSAVSESFFSVSDLAFLVLFSAVLDLASLVVFSIVSESFFSVSDLAFLLLFSVVSELAFLVRNLVSDL